MDLCNAEENCPAKVLTRPDAEVWSHLQNPSTDVSAAGLTFHPKLGMVICLTVRNSIPATKNKPNECNMSETYFVVVSLGVKGVVLGSDAHLLADVLSC